MFKVETCFDPEKSSALLASGRRLKSIATGQPESGQIDGARLDFNGDLARNGLLWLATQLQAGHMFEFGKQFGIGQRLGKLFAGGAHITVDYLPDEDKVGVKIANLESAKNGGEVLISASVDQRPAEQRRPLVIRTDLQGASEEQVWAAAMLSRPSVVLAATSEAVHMAERLTGYSI